MHLAQLRACLGLFRTDLKDSDRYALAHDRDRNADGQTNFFPTPPRLVIQHHFVHHTYLRPSHLLPQKMHTARPLIQILREQGNYRTELRSTQSDSPTVGYDFQGTVHYDEGKRGQRGESESCIVSFGKHGEGRSLQITLSGSEQDVVCKIDV